MTQLAIDWTLVGVKAASPGSKRRYREENDNCKHKRSARNGNGRLISDRGLATYLATEKLHLQTEKR